jgi:hypothetical protein
MLQERDDLNISSDFCECACSVWDHSAFGYPKFKRVGAELGNAENWPRKIVSNRLNTLTARLESPKTAHVLEHRS